MVARRLLIVNPYMQIYNQTSFKPKELKDKIAAYFTKHSFLIKIVAFIGMPIGILLAVGGITAVWGILILAITSL